MAYKLFTFGVGLALLPLIFVIGMAAFAGRMIYFLAGDFGRGHIDGIQGIGHEAVQWMKRHTS